MAAETSVETAPPATSNLIIKPNNKLKPISDPIRDSISNFNQIIRAQDEKLIYRSKCTTPSNNDVKTTTLFNADVPTTTIMRRGEDWKGREEENSGSDLAKNYKVINENSRVKKKWKPQLAAEETTSPILIGICQMKRTETSTLREGVMRIVRPLPQPPWPPPKPPWNGFNQHATRVTTSQNELQWGELPISILTCINPLTIVTDRHYHHRIYANQSTSLVNLRKLSPNRIDFTQFVTKYRNVLIDNTPTYELMTAQASTAGASNNKAPPSSYEEVVGPML